MSISRTIGGVSALLRRKPLIFNSLVYGFLYTGAEFVQQTINRKSHLEESASKLMPTVSADESVFKWVRRFNETLGLDQDSATRPGDYNLGQLKRYAVYGCFLAGPILHGWYTWLDAYYQGTSQRIILKKLLVDQFVLVPPLLVLFFVSMSLMEGKSDVFAECRAKFAKTFQTSCIFWLPVQFANFLLVPSALRVLYVGVAAFCWINILCYLKSTPLRKAEAK